MKGTSRKVFSAILAASFIIGAAGCGAAQGGGRTSGGADDNAEAVTTAAPVTTTVDPNREIDEVFDYDEAADIDEVSAENEQGAGKLYETGKPAGTIHALCWFDFHNVSPEIEISELFAERFGGTVETEIVSSLEITDRLGVLMASGQSPDIMRFGEDYFPSFFIANRFAALDDWIDIYAPIWSGMEEINERFAYDGKHFYLPYGLTATEYGVTYCTAELEENGIPDPMDLYFSGEWTWDAFKDIVFKWRDFNPEKYPISWPTGIGVHLAATTGTPVIEFDGKNIVNNMKDANVVRAMEFIESLKREDCFWEGWHGPDALDSWAGTLFFLMPLDWGLPCGQEFWFKKNFEGEIRSVPLPRDPESDTYYLYGQTSGYVIPSGATNMQGAVSFLLAARTWYTDPDVVAAEREEKLYNGGYFYIKCPECKYKFESERDEFDAVCPNCGAPRKAKYKLTYTPEQMQIYDDLLDPSKFTFIFNAYSGFGPDMKQQMEDVFNGPITEGESYNHLVTEYYNVIETELDEYRALLS